MTTNPAVPNNLQVLPNILKMFPATRLTFPQWIAKYAPGAVVSKCILQLEADFSIKNLRKLPRDKAIKRLEGPFLMSLALLSVCVFYLIVFRNSLPAAAKAIIIEYAAVGLAGASLATYAWANLPRPVAV